MATKSKKKRKDKCDLLNHEFKEFFQNPDGSTFGVLVKDSSVFRLGECFDSYDELLNRLASHSKQSKVHYWRRDSRTVKGAYMKTTRPLEPRLVYYYVKYACVFGGQKFAPRGKGQRQSMTMRTDCPAHIMVRANKTGRQLQVISVCNTHNHPITEQLYKSLPQDRKLDPSIKQEVLNLLKRGVENKCVLEYVHQATGKTLTNKDLFNLGAGEKKPKNPAKTRRKVSTTSGAKSPSKRTQIIESDARMIEDSTGVELQTEIGDVLHNENNNIRDMSPLSLYEHPSSVPPHSTTNGGGVVDTSLDSFFCKDKDTLLLPNSKNHMIDGTFLMIEGDEITDTDIIIENVGIITSSADAQQLQDESAAIFHQQMQNVAAGTVVDSVSNAMTLNKVNLKLVNIDDFVMGNNKVLIQHLPPDPNENTVFNSLDDVPIDEIDLNNIVVIRDTNLHQDDGNQLVQMYKLNTNDELNNAAIGLHNSNNNNNDTNNCTNDDDRLDDYIAFQTDQDFVGFPDDVVESKSIIVDSLQEDCIAMLVNEENCRVNDIPSDINGSIANDSGVLQMNLQRDQICESCGRTGLIIENDIERLKREKESIEHEVQMLEMRRDMLRNELRRETSLAGMNSRDWVLELAHETPVQYIFVDQ